MEIKSATHSNYRDQEQRDFRESTVLCCPIFQARSDAKLRYIMFSFCRKWDYPEVSKTYQYLIFVLLLNKYINDKEKFSNDN